VGPTRSEPAQHAGLWQPRVDDAGGGDQFGEWGNGNEGWHTLIAVAHYLVAHSPTERATLQTANIARRLMRGGELHQDVIAP
jgi:hypothetical protein